MSREWVAWDADGWKSRARGEMRPNHRALRHDDGWEAGGHQFPFFIGRRAPHCGNTLLRPASSSRWRALQQQTQVETHKQWRVPHCAIPRSSDKPMRSSHSFESHSQRFALPLILHRAVSQHTKTKSLPPVRCRMVA
jgi:hypothetical protein